MRTDTHGPRLADYREERWREGREALQRRQEVGGGRWVHTQCPPPATEPQTIHSSAPQDGACGAH